LIKISSPAISDIHYKGTPVVAKIKKVKRIRFSVSNIENPESRFSPKLPKLSVEAQIPHY
jgi:hypothetical protein